MIELPCAADIRCSAETIVDLIVDFGAQDRWHDSRGTLLALKAYADTLS